MTIFLMIFFIFLLITSRPVKNNDEYLSKKNTNIIKGFFLILVFFSHFRGYDIVFSEKWYDSIAITVCKKVGQLMVVMFLFYSGYGIMESIKNKGQSYIDNLPRKRILRTWLNFAFSVFVYMIASKYYIYNDFSIKEMILTYIGLDTYGNSNWYIFCIIMLYFITYISAKSFKDLNKVLISTFVGVILYTAIMGLYKETWWYDTSFCYVLGALYSVYKEKIELWLENRNLLCLVYSVVFFIIAYHFKNNIIWNYLHTLLFAVIIIIISRKVRLNNVFFEWIGRNLFPMYIFQRLPMMLLVKNEFMAENPYVFFVVAFISTICITYIYNTLLYLINKIKESRKLVKE